MDHFQLSTHSYRVHLPGTLSAGRPREGFLVRVEWPARDASLPPIRGYADLMSWPELGDLTIHEEMEAILRGIPTTLGRRVLEMARLDATARQRNESLWTGLGEPPASHYLAGSVADLPHLDLEHVRSRGFRSIKLKWPATISVDSGQEKIAEALSALRQSGLRLRLDFNGSAELDALASCFERWPELHNTLEFLEDPFPAEKPEDWLAFRERVPGIALYADRVDVDDEELLALADGWVIKPALQGLDWIARAHRGGGRSQPLSFTQYLGHAVGAAWAAWHAAHGSPDQLRDSGLLFESRIEGESESLGAAITPSGCRFPTLRLREGQGIGWTETEFASLTWRPWQ
jgi:O-succinylbenzoate synthase